MIVETSRFGELEIDENKVIEFPEGLPGFETHRRFTFVAHENALHGGASPFRWMQSLESSNLAFLAVEPKHYFADYAPKISSGELESIGLTSLCESVQLFAILTVPVGDPRGITANLLAPIAVNIDQRVGRQVVAMGDDYGLRHRLLGAQEDTASCSNVSRNGSKRNHNANGRVAVASSRE